MSPTQIIGLHYFEDFQQKIPRSEMGALFQIVSSTLDSIDKNILSEVCGSYRRGRLECGDIDIIITHENSNLLNDLLYKVLIILKNNNFITDNLITVDKTSKKYMGVCQLTKNHLHRRIDMLVLLHQEWAFSLLYFTGSGHFNR